MKPAGKVHQGKIEGRHTDQTGVDGTAVATELYFFEITSTYPNSRHAENPQTGSSLGKCARTMTEKITEVVEKLKWHGYVTAVFAFLAAFSRSPQPCLDKTVHDY